MHETQQPHGSVVARIRERIVSGDFSPGDLLAEARLAEELSVSRTPIREAFKQLQIEGLIEVRARVGTFVRKPTQREITELFQLKESLEGLAAGLLARRGPTPALDRLIANVALEREAATAGDRATFADLVHDFHTTLVAGADNQKLAEHYELLMNQLAYHRIVMQTLSTPGRLAHSFSEHDQIVEAIQTKDPLAAELATRRHVAASSQLATVAAFTDEATKAAAVNASPSSPAPQASGVEADATDR